MGSLDAGDRYRLKPACRRCKKDTLTADAKTHCCDCGFSLCRRCSAGECGTKVHHRTVDLTGTEPAVNAELYSRCSKCKKGRGKCMATKHCFDCGKSYCDRCSKVHEKTKTTKWHELVDVEELFEKVRVSPEPSAPPLSDLRVDESVSSEKADMAEMFLRGSCDRSMGQTHGRTVTRPIPIPARSTQHPGTPPSTGLYPTLPSSPACCGAGSPESPPPYSPEDFFRSRFHLNMSVFSYDASSYNHFVERFQGVLVSPEPSAPG